MAEMDDAERERLARRIVDEALRQALADVKDYRQALWDIYGILGFDTDGDPTPDALVRPSLIELVVSAAREARQAYDEEIEHTFMQDQARAAAYIVEIGGSVCDDPVGFLISSHRQLASRRG